MKTKDRILDAALFLFNESGIKNVRLQHIADETGISVGNLAYHYPDKKQIILSLERKIEDIVFRHFSKWKDVTYLIDFDNKLIQLYHFLNNYSFYFQDALEIQRTYPDIHQNRLIFIQSMIHEIADWIEQQQENDFIRLPVLQENSSQLAEMIWFICAFWLTKNKILNKTEEDEIAFRRAVWSQLLTYFTKRGISEYNALILPGLEF